MKNKEEALLRSIIREFVEAYAVRGGSQPDESYDELLDDEAFDAPSVLVPDDIKKKIKKWAKDMKLST